LLSDPLHSEPPGRLSPCDGRRNAPHELRQHDQAENPHTLFGSEPVGANHDPGIEFAPDSPLEGDGFEPSVPHHGCGKNGRKQATQDDTFMPGGGVKPPIKACG
jgi:hypothetical protein